MVGYFLGYKSNYRFENIARSRVHVYALYKQFKTFCDSTDFESSYLYDYYRATSTCSLQRLCNNTVERRKTFKIPFYSELRYTNLHCSTHRSTNIIRNSFNIHYIYNSFISFNASLRISYVDIKHI